MSGTGDRTTLKRVSTTVESRPAWQSAAEHSRASRSIAPRSAVGSPACGPS
jgi:hypothetical protein